MRYIGLTAALLACCLIIPTFTSGQPPRTSGNSLMLYDDFRGPRIDPAKWSDFDAAQGDLDIAREVIPPSEGQSEARNGQLHLLEQSYSSPWDDNGEAYGYIALAFANPAPIKEVAFSLSARNSAVSQCQSNPGNESSAWAGFTGRMFNYGGGLDPDEDVSASIQLNRGSSNPTGALTVSATVSTGGPLAFWNLQQMGTIKPGHTAKLRVKWDQGNKQFLFQLDNDAPVAIPYTVDDSSAPYYQLKAIEVGHGVPDCTTQPTGSTMMDAYFDNVYIGVQ